MNSTKTVRILIKTIIFLPLSFQTFREISAVNDLGFCSVYLRIISKNCYTYSYKNFIFRYTIGSVSFFLTITMSVITTIMNFGLLQCKQISQAPSRCILYPDNYETKLVKSSYPAFFTIQFITYQSTDYTSISVICIHDSDSQQIIFITVIFLINWADFSCLNILLLCQ